MTKEQDQALRDLIGITDSIRRAKEHPERFLRQAYGKKRAKQVIDMAHETNVTLAALLDFKFQLDNKLHELIEVEMDTWVDVYTTSFDPMKHAKLRFLFTLMAVTSLGLQEHAYNHLCASLSMVASESNIDSVLEKLEQIIEEIK